MSSNFNKHVTHIFIDVCKDRESTELSSVADDVFGCDSSFIKSALCDFMLEKSCHVGLVDRKSQ